MRQLVAACALTALAVFLFSALVPAQGQGGAPRQGQADLQKMLLANERAINDAFTKGDAAKFKDLVTADGWDIEVIGPPTSTAEMLKSFDQMAKELKIISWDITDVRLVPVDANAAVLIYKWTGNGTYQGKPIPSETWASTVWARRAGKWQAVFHQETLVTATPPKK